MRRKLRPTSLSLQDHLRVTTWRHDSKGVTLSDLPLERTPIMSTRLLPCLLCVSLAWPAPHQDGRKSLGEQDPAPTAEEEAVDTYFQRPTDITSDTGPQVITRNVLQDRKGGFWLATWNGVVHFDGSTFTNVTFKEKLRRYRAFTLLEDRDGNIWLGTTGAGAYRFDGTVYTHFTTKDGLVSDTVLSMCQDREGNIWIGGLGLSKFDGKTFTSFTKEDGFTNTDVCSISQASDGALWFGTRGALFRYDGKAFVNFTDKHRAGVEKNSYIPALIDQEGHIWFGGSTGIFYYDGDKLRHLLKLASFSLFEDSKGHIWFTGGALRGRDPKPRTTVLNRFDRAAGLENLLSSSKQFEVDRPAVFGLTEDKDGGIWLGTNRGVARIEGDGVRFL